MHYKKIIVGIGLIGSTILTYNIGKNQGYNQGYNQGFEDTKTEIRKYAVNLKQGIYRREQEATQVCWSWTDTTKIYTYGKAYQFEKDAFRDCYIKIDDAINYDIDRLTKGDLIKTIKFNKLYEK